MNNRADVNFQNIEKSKSSNNLLKNNIVGVNKEKIAFLLMFVGPSFYKTIKAQIAPPNICVEQQISSHTFVLNVPYIIPLSGNFGANLGVPNNGSSVFKLQKIENGQYIPVGGLYAISGDETDTLVITRTYETGDNSITYFDADCIPTDSTINLLLLPLPVTRLDNGAEKNSDGTANIRWTVAQENNNDKFVVERTTDQVNWKAIEEVKGRGDAVEPKRYSITDENPAHGVNYYRVKQVDFDGKSSYSPIKTLSFNEVNSKISIYPNPTANYIEVEGDAIESIVVYNQLGHEVKVKIDGNKVDLSGLPNGILFIETTQAGNNVQMHRVVKSSD